PEGVAWDARGPPPAGDSGRARPPVPEPGRAALRAWPARGGWMRTDPTRLATARARPWVAPAQREAPADVLPRPGQGPALSRETPRQPVHPGPGPARPGTTPGTRPAPRRQSNTRGVSDGDA